MTFLPLHAAGHHRDTGSKERRSVLDRAVSSYASTIRALRYARHDREVSPSEAARAESAVALVVAMPETPQALRLPGASAEAARLVELLPGVRTLVGPEATRDVVLEALPRHRIAHLSCHGLNDWNAPASSRLLLHDHVTDPLTVVAVSRIRLPDAELAYLSACSTTTTNLRLADQAVHITAAFQLAGYRHVIGTLWSIDDAVAVRVTDHVYTHLTDGGRTAPRTEQAALALHQATRGSVRTTPRAPACGPPTSTPESEGALGPSLSVTVRMVRGFHGQGAVIVSESPYRKGRPPHDGMAVSDDERLCVDSLI
ncbi:CHAT domain-containing protein [Streptosporangium lutulentum]